MGSARPFTISTPADINNDGVSNDRAVVNGLQTSLDQFRGWPFYQVDFRVTRNITLGGRVTFRPFIEFFNLFNRQNPGNNFVRGIGSARQARNQVNRRRLDHGRDAVPLPEMQVFTGLSGH